MGRPPINILGVVTYRSMSYNCRPIPVPRATRRRTPSQPKKGRAPLSLLTLLAHNRRLIDLLPALHQHALDATGGTRTLLFEHNPRNGALQATSGFGLEALPIDPWIPKKAEATLVDDAFRRGAPVLVANTAREAPSLAARLNARAALLLPLAHGQDRIGMLAVGFNARLAAVPPRAPEAADAFLAALDLSHHRRNEDLQRDIRQLLDEFAGSLSATLNLAAGLDIFCDGANRLFGADRTSVWIHDRRAHHLVLRASSDPEHAQRGMQVAADDPQEPAAAAMRGARAEILARGGAATCTVTVPLRGTRRALGTVVFEGARIEPGGDLDLLDRADELGRQLSNAIENLQLLDDVLRSRRELENTFDSIAHLVIVCDRGGHIVHANKAFATLVGRTREQLLDRPLSDVVGADLAGWIAERQGQPVQLDHQEPTTREIVDPMLKAPFYVTVTDLLDHERERVGHVIVARDLTPHTKLEAEREELRRRLTQSEKLAALGQFVAGIAHELNNPLQGVLGHLELLRATGAFPKQLRREVWTIYREADRAAKIVRNLLVFAGSRRLARRSVSLNPVLQKVLALRADACRAADIEVVRHYDDKLPRVSSDPLLLHQVFLNMVMNAEHALADANHARRIEVTSTLAPSKEAIIVTVRDNGSGIAPDALSHIFEPFYTTKDVGKGTGLGLAIAYGIVQEHGGHIMAANHPDGGAMFTVELPVTRKPAEKSDQ